MLTVTGKKVRYAAITAFPASQTTAIATSTASERSHWRGRAPARSSRLEFTRRDYTSPHEEPMDLLIRNAAVSGSMRMSDAHAAEAGKLDWLAFGENGHGGADAVADAVQRSRKVAETTKGLAAGTPCLYVSGGGAPDPYSR